MIDEILNVSDNVNDQGNFVFTESYFKIAPTDIDDYTKNICLNMKREKLRPQRNIENNDKKNKYNISAKF